MSANLMCLLVFLIACAIGYFGARRIGRGRFVAAFICAICAICGLALAQPPSEPQVDMAEIRRLGDHVQYVDGDAKTSSGDYVEVMGPPADDNHKWFISIVGSKGCAACARLKADLKTDEYLRALITVHENDDNHSDTKSSWAHYTYYLADDASQKFRWEKIKLSGYPTIIVQPPLNKKYGDPATVVCQITGYDGDGKKLATNIAAAIKTYLAKQAERRQQGHRAQLVSIVKARDEGRGARGEEDSPPEPPAPNSLDPRSSILDPRGWGQAPWTPAPKVDPPVGPHPSPDNVLPPIFDWPPKPAPGPAPKPDGTPATPDGAIPATPECVIVCETNVLSREDEARIRPVLERIKRERPGLRVRIADLRDAKNLPVQQSELPAVVVTSDGKVDEKVTARLFPLFTPAEPAATPATQVVAPPFPWQEVATAVATGGSIPTVAAAALALFVWWRQRRRALNQPVLAPNLPLEQLAPLVQPFITQIAAAIAEALKPKQQG